MLLPENWTDYYQWNLDTYVLHQCSSVSWKLFMRPRSTVGVVDALEKLFILYCIVVLLLWAPKFCGRVWPDEHLNTPSRRSAQPTFSNSMHAEFWYSHGIKSSWRFPQTTHEKKSKHEDFFRTFKTSNASLPHASSFKNYKEIRKSNQQVISGNVGSGPIH